MKGSGGGEERESEGKRRRGRGRKGGRERGSRRKGWRRKGRVERYRVSMTKFLLWYRFREGKEKVLIMTNLCARSIDVEQVTVVVNDISIDIK